MQPAQFRAEQEVLAAEFESQYKDNISLLADNIRLKEEIVVLKAHDAEHHETPPPPPPPPPPPAGYSKILEPPAGKMLIGVSPEGLGFAGYTAQFGPAHLGHVYERGPSSFLSAGDIAAGKGMVPLINCKPLGVMGPATYKAILSGEADDELLIIATRIKAYGKPVMVAWMHEPENDDKTPASYKVNDPIYADAFWYCCDAMESNGVKRAKDGGTLINVWNMMGWKEWFLRYGDDGLYPGDEHVDWIAGDIYFHSTTDSFLTKVKPFYDVIKSHNKPMMLAEFGIANPVASNASKFLSAAALKAGMDAMPLWKGLVYWDNGVGGSAYHLASLPAGVWKTFDGNAAFGVPFPAGITA